MKYQGSKRRISKFIIPIINSYRSDNQYYIEPFCGGCNVIDKIDGKRIASDNNEYVIELCKQLSNGWLPPKDISEELFNDVKQNIDKYEKHFVGYIGTQMTFGSLWFSSIRRDKVRNMALESYNNVYKQAPHLKGIEFIHSEYYNLELPPNSLIYCDPPYKGVTGYAHKFDSELFYKWCEEKVKEGHIVLVSEYNAPDNWTILWEKEITSQLNNKKRVGYVNEKLFLVSI